MTNNRCLQQKNELFNKLDSVKLNISVSSVKACRNGSVIISCSNTDKIKNLVNDTLKNYNVKRLPSLNPRLRISGINRDISEDSIVEYLICGNQSNLI